MSDKINSHISLMLSVYKSFHETVKYGRCHEITYPLKITCPGWQVISVQNDPPLDKNSQAHGTIKNVYNW